MYVYVYIVICIYTHVHNDIQTSNICGATFVAAPTRYITGFPNRKLPKAVAIHQETRAAKHHTSLSYLASYLHMASSHLDIINT